MELRENVPTKTITIKGLTFNVPAPFSEGHVLRANEANVLNQTFAENLRNNFASTVAEAIEEAEKLGNEADKEGLQASLDAYVLEYDFGIRSSGGGQPKLEPRVRIARDLAKEKIKEKIRAAGHKVSDFDTAKLNELALNLVEKDPFYLTEADRQLAATQDAALDSIDLSGLEPKAPEAAPAAEAA